MHCSSVFILETFTTTEAEPNTMTTIMEVTTTDVVPPTTAAGLPTTVQTDVSGPVTTTDTSVFPTSEISIASESSTTKLEADTSGPPTESTNNVQSEVETVAEGPSTMAPTVDMATPDVPSGHPTVGRDQQTTLEGSITDASGPFTDHPTTMKAAGLITTTAFPTSLTSESSTTNLEAGTSGAPTESTNNVQTEVETVAGTMAPTVDMATPDVASGHPTTDASGPPTATTLEMDTSGSFTGLPVTTETVEPVLMDTSTSEISPISNTEVEVVSTRPGPTADLPSTMETSVFPTTEVLKSPTMELADTSGPPVNLPTTAGLVTVTSEIISVTSETRSSTTELEAHTTGPGTGFKTSLPLTTTDTPVFPTSEILQSTEPRTTELNVDTSNNLQTETETVPFGNDAPSTMAPNVETTNDASGPPTELSTMVTTALLARFKTM